MKIDAAATSPQHRRRERPLVIGLTGPIASGKSMIANDLRARGAEILDADLVYRSLLAPGSDLSQRIIDHFGSEVSAPNGEIDRAALGERVFANPEALAELEQITHPAVVAEIRSLIDRSMAPVVVIEAVKLVQSGLAADVDSLWLINADVETRLKRLMARSGMDEVAARARIAAAPNVVPEGFPVDVLLENSGDVSDTLHAVESAWQTLSMGEAND